METQIQKLLYSRTCMMCERELNETETPFLCEFCAERLAKIYDQHPEEQDPSTYPSDEEREEWAQEWASFEANLKDAKE